MDFLSNADENIDVKALSEIMKNVSLIYREEESRKILELINVIRLLGEGDDEPCLESKIVSLSELREDVPRADERFMLKTDGNGYVKTTPSSAGDNK